jgi:hypothetical protein
MARVPAKLLPLKAQLQAVSDAVKAQGLVLNSAGVHSIWTGPGWGLQVVLLVTNEELSCIYPLVIVREHMEWMGRDGLWSAVVATVKSDPNGELANAREGIKLSLKARDELDRKERERERELGVIRARMSDYDPDFGDFSD